jgi:hypothetical protein
MLEDRNSKSKAIEWASKKLTDSERRYSITGKEMLAVYRGMMEFEYELKGRRFRLKTDHKAPEAIKTKTFFRINDHKVD